LLQLGAKKKMKKTVLIVFIEQKDERLDSLDGMGEEIRKVVQLQVNGWIWSAKLTRCERFKARV